MVGSVSETAHATSQAYAATSTVAAEMTLMVVTLKQNRGYAKPQTAKVRITRATCTTEKEDDRT
jgi:hypothetical protein